MGRQQRDQLCKPLGKMSRSAGGSGIRQKSENPAAEFRRIPLPPAL
jgi:hypothetical protein